MRLTPLPPNELPPGLKPFYDDMLKGVEAFGDQGTAEFVYLIGGYRMISVMLNAYDVSVPGREEELG